MGLKRDYNMALQYFSDSGYFMAGYSSLQSNLELSILSHTPKNINI
ncbi:hypothetical protein ABOONEI_2453 [Aciduliprofundum boonei T469]|nr:hypothetical protein ABOONEI_2453 [Aciduliprofundum boonei T469]